MKKYFNENAKEIQEFQRIHTVCMPNPVGGPMRIHCAHVAQQICIGPLTGFGHALSPHAHTRDIGTALTCIYILRVL